MTAPIRYTPPMPTEQLIENTTPRYARVVLPIPVDQSFTYEIPEGMRGRVQVGCRVEVPFGKRMLNGVVVDLASIADVPRIRPIHELQETFAPPHLLALATWIASYYGCSRGEAMQAVIPPSLKRAKRRKGGKLSQE